MRMDGKANYAAIPTVPDEPSTVGTARSNFSAFISHYYDRIYYVQQIDVANATGVDAPVAIGNIPQKRGDMMVMETPVDKFCLPEATKAYLRAKNPVERPEVVRVDRDDDICLTLLIRDWHRDLWAFNIACLAAFILEISLYCATSRCEDPSCNTSRLDEPVIFFLGSILIITCVGLALFLFRKRPNRPFIVITVSQDEISVITHPTKFYEKTMSLLDKDGSIKEVCCERQVKEAPGKVPSIAYAVHIVWDNDIRALIDTFPDMKTALYIRQEIEGFLCRKGMMNMDKMDKVKAEGSDAPTSGSISQQRGDTIVVETPVDAHGNFCFPEATEAYLRSQGPVERPQGVRVDRNDGICLVLSIRFWHRVYYYSFLKFIFLFISFALAFYFLVMFLIWVNYGFDETDGVTAISLWDVWLGCVILPTTGVSIGPALFLILKWASWRVITVSQDQMMVGTLLLKCFGCQPKEVLSLLDPDRRFREVCCRRHVNHTDDHLNIEYDVHVLWEDNRRTLIAKFPDIETSLYIQQELERFIIRNVTWRVP